MGNTVVVKIHLRVKPSARRFWRVHSLGAKNSLQLWWESRVPEAKVGVIVIGGFILSMSLAFGSTF